MRIIVTGGAGFIGSALVRHLIAETSHCVLNLDKLTYAGNLDSLVGVSASPRYAFERVDICDRTAVEKVFREYQPEAIMHLAAESHVDRSIAGPSIFVETNVVGTTVLLEAATDYWRSLADVDRQAFRFHHISTDEVYGDLPAAAPAFTEDTPYAPSSPYAASKASADHMVRAWSRTFGLPTVITNCSNNYGPRQFPEKFIPLMIVNGFEGRALPIYGRGDQRRDWLYVEDHVKALLLVLHQGSLGETYNIGGHNERRNIDVANAVCDCLELMAPDKPAGVVRYRDLITHVADRPGHDERYAIDASKMADEFGWKPLETFDTGLRKTVQWYLDNQDWVRRAKSGAYRDWLETNYARRTGQA